MFNPYATQTISYSYKDERTHEEYPIVLLVKRLNAKQANMLTTKYSFIQAQIKRAETESLDSGDTVISNAASDLELLFRSQLAYTVVGIEGVDFGSWGAWPESIDDRLEYLNELGSSFVQQAILAYNKSGEAPVSGKSSQPSRKHK